MSWSRVIAPIIGADGDLHSATRRRRPSRRDQPARQARRSISLDAVSEPAALAVREGLLRLCHRRRRRRLWPARPEGDPRARAPGDGGRSAVLPRVGDQADRGDRDDAAGGRGPAGPPRSDRAYVPEFRARTRTASPLGTCSPTRRASPTWTSTSCGASARTRSGSSSTSAARPLSFEPGSRYAYASDSFYLLAEVIARLTGMPFARPCGGGCSRRSVRMTVLRPPHARRRIMTVHGVPLGNRIVRELDPAVPGPGHAARRRALRHGRGPAPFRAVVASARRAPVRGSCPRRPSTR